MSHVIPSMLSISISGIPGSAWPSHGTTKNLYFTQLSFCLISTVHMLSCSMFDELYVFKMTVLFIVVCNLAIVDFENKILNTLNGIKLTSLAVST